MLVHALRRTAAATEMLDGWQNNTLPAFMGVHYRKPAISAHMQQQGEKK